MKRKLIALYPILYEAKQYEVGEELPTNNNEMTENWIKGGAAKWNEEAEEENKASVVVVREEYEKRMANMEEQHKLELEKIKNEKEEAITKYNELLKSQALGDLEESKEKDDNKDSKNEENQQSSKTKAKLSKKTDK
ncbi:MULTISPECIES: hypothetical protein [Clostridium]|uniref:Phage protein n=1 Tax=Clostridium carnis TaxID=1530 RepID=A0ABY6SZX0_9CLOT|nr:MULTISPECIES: hypothetical protein [Clostridium]CAI3570839.1 hypothetical protein CNEO4_1260017 [Clostridium neonatale]CAI3656308.1 hypothetical protein CNEO4_2320017 [Clostridium neonatale]CAI3657261.1 hypothetical protein CNEO3_680013 [Clostridium neonatale]CAI3700309.1 hypothetical protein CNEO3_760012 [Clostridium neonatale]CAI3700679.1 hypothetical protein CNEO3_810017 [Clostridium neonatale]